MAANNTKRPRTMANLWADLQKAQNRVLRNYGLEPGTAPTQVAASRTTSPRKTSKPTTAKRRSARRNKPSETTPAMDNSDD